MAFDLNTVQGLEHAEQVLMKAIREAQHALGTVRLHQLMDRFAQGLLASHELHQEVYTVLKQTHPLRVGDTDLVTDVVVDTAEAFLARVDQSFAFRSVESHDLGNGITLHRVEPDK